METKILSAYSKEEMEEAANIIRQGGLVAFPTETVYGLGANALLADGARRIYLAKGRPSDNPLIVHLANASDAEKYAYTCDTYYRLAESFMPGPLTVILPKRDVIPNEVTGGLKTVGIRVPSNETARNLIKLSGVPIAAPSANLSGKPSTTKACHVVADLFGKIDGIIDGGDSEIGLESTIVMIDNGIIRMLRPGAVTKEMIEQLGYTVILDKAIVEKPGEGERPLAPGMMYRHYAPSAEVTLLDGDDKSITEALCKYASQEGSVVLCYSEDKQISSLKNAYVIGRREDSANTAHRLFAILRELDEMKDIKHIYAALPDNTGIGLAIFNRLVKAAGYKVIKL